MIVLALLVGLVRLDATQDPVSGPPTPLPGTTMPAPEAPGAFAWTVSVNAAPIVPAIVAGEFVVSAHVPGLVVARHLRDGSETWRREFVPVQPLVSDGTHVFVAAGEAIHAIRLSDGALAWRSPAGSFTAPLLVKDGWIIAAGDTKLTARRASDGTSVWTVDSGPQREAAAISGDVLYVPMADGRVVARDLATGQPRWQTQLGGAPVQPLVVNDALFVGAGDKKFYCLKASSGEISWHRNVGALIRGAATFDADRVFFAALDNSIHAVDRSHGALRWQAPLRFRPVAGPTVAGGMLFVPGTSTVELLRVVDGTRINTVAFPARLGQPAGVFPSDLGVLLAGVTGGLEEAWSLSLTLPIGASTPPPSR